MDKNSEILIFFGFKSIEHFFSGIQCCDELRQFVNVFVSISFHVTVQSVFQGPCYTFSKCSFILTHSRVNLYSFSFEKFLNFPANSVPFWTQFLLGRFLFVIMAKTARTVSLESFVFFLFALTVLSNTSWRTSRYFTPFLTLASLSTHDMSIHQISFLNLANAFILLNLCVVSLNFVKEGFDRKNCLTFNNGRLLSFSKLRTEP